MRTKLREDLIFLTFNKNNHWIFDPRFDVQYKINSTGLEIIKLIKKINDYKKILRILKNRYKLTEGVLKEEVSDFFELLNKFHLTKDSIKNFNYLYVNWHLTTHCNLKCKHCYVEDPNQSSEMSLKEKLMVIDSLLSYTDFCFFYFSGGEIFVVPYFLKIIDRIPSNKGSITFTTNGTIINRYFHGLDKNKGKIRGIMVSIAGASEVTHQYLRGVKLNPILKNIRKLVVMNFPVGIAFDVYKDNIFELEDAIKLAIKLGVQNITFNPIENIGGKSSLLKTEEFLTHEDLKFFIHKLKELEKEYQNQIIIGNTLLLRDKPVCKKMLEKIGYNCSVYDPNMLFITPNGEVHSCYIISLITNKFFLGKLPENEISTITQNKIRKISFAKKLERQICKKCEFKFRCEGACLAEVIRKNKEFFERNCRKGLKWSEI